VFSLCCLQGRNWMSVCSRCTAEINFGLQGVGLELSPRNLECSVQQIRAEWVRIHKYCWMPLVGGMFVLSTVAPRTLPIWQQPLITLTLHKVLLKCGKTLSSEQKCPSSFQRKRTHVNDESADHLRGHRLEVRHSAMRKGQLQYARTLNLSNTCLIRRVPYNHTKYMLIFETKTGHHSSTRPCS
jgi:hypothetical protein